MKRVLVWFVSGVLLAGLAGCTPAGKPSEDDSFSLPASSEEAASSPDALPAPDPHAGMKFPTSEPADPATVGDHTIALGPKLSMTAPENWVPKAPAMQMIAQEYAVPAVEGDSQDGRVTVMTAGGSVEANIDRWKGQFSQPEGAEAADQAKVEKKTVAGQEVHVVDLSGTYQDSRGPFAPAVERPDYRMLAAIIPLAEATHFIKFYGPKKTVAANETAFQAMIEGMKVKP